jgi:hypothetical protein
VSGDVGTAATREGRDRRDRGSAEEEPPTTPAAGIVMNQPPTMFLATPQRTALTRRVAPTPMIAEVITCVVETGTLNRYEVA